MSRALSCALVLVAAAFVASGCGGSAEPAKGANGGTVITFVTGRDPSGFVENAEKQCEKASGNKYDIQEIVMPPAVDQAREQLTRRLAAGDPSIDFINLDVVWTAEFSDAGWLVDLTERVEPIKGDFMEASINSAHYKGKYWAVPVVTNAAMLYYRTDLVPKKPETWEQVKEYAKAAIAKDPELDGFIFQGAPYEGGTVDALEFIHSAEGGTLSEDGKKTEFTKGAGTAKALAFLKSLMDEGVSPKAVTTYMEEDTRQAFQNGGAVFMRNWPYAASLAQSDKASKVKDRFAVTPLPGFEDGRPASVLGGQNYGISSFSRNKELVWEAISCMSSYDVQKDKLIVRGELPTRSAVYDDPEVAKKIPLIKEFKAAVESGNNRPVTPYYNDVTGVIYKAYNEVLQGRLSPKDAAKRMDEDVQKAIDGEAEI